MPPALLPWRNWYHVIGNTYGTWLPGDPRGFRIRHHSDHVEGDYKHPPPPGQYDAWLRRARRHMKRDAVLLTPEERHLACLAMGEKLIVLGVELIDLSVSQMHYHILARFTPYSGDPQRPGMTMPGLSPHHRRRDGLDPTPRLLVGRAKKHASHLACEKGRLAPAGLWAVRSHIVPIVDRQHQLNLAHYIRGHAEQGAAVYTQATSSTENSAGRHG